VLARTLQQQAGATRSSPGKGASFSAASVAHYSAKAHWADFRMDADLCPDLLEEYLSSMVNAIANGKRVDAWVAGLLVESIRAMGTRALSTCTAKTLSLLIWEVFVLYDCEMVAFEDAMPAMRMLAGVAAEVPMSLFLPIDVAQVTLNLAKFGLVQSGLTGTLGHSEPGQVLTGAKWFDRLAAGEAMGLDWEGVAGAKGVEQSIANTIYGLALVKCSSATGFINRLIAAAMTLLPTFTPQGCSNMLWGLAKLQHPLDSPQLLATTGHTDAASLVGTILQLAVLPQLHKFNSHDASNTVYALALLQLPSNSQVGNAVAATVDRALELVKEGKYEPQAVANILWGCVNLKHKLSPEQALLLADASARSAARCLPHAMTIAMWALGIGGYSAAAMKLQKPLLAYLQANSADFKPQDLSMTANALAKLGLHCPELFSALVAAAKPKLDEFDSQELANLLHSLASLEPTTYCSFFKELQPLLLSRLWGFKEQDVANTGWAYAVVLGEKTSREMVLGILWAACGKGVDQIEHLVQLFQLMAVSSAEVQAAVEADQNLRDLKQRGGTVYEERLVAPHETQFGKQVQAMLPALGAVFYSGFAVNCFGLQLRTNMLKYSNGQQRVFDVVPASKYSSHSTTAQQHRELGSLFVRRRMLAKAGWPGAVMIPAEVWERLQGQEARLQYLRQKLG
jgi:hypothetical protein